MYLSSMCAWWTWMYSRSWIQWSRSALLPNWHGGHWWCCREKFTCGSKKAFSPWAATVKKTSVKLLASQLELQRAQLRLFLFWIFNSWRFCICKTFHMLIKAILKSETTLQCKVYGLSRYSGAGPMGRNQVCRVTRKYTWKPENFLSMLGKQFSTVWMGGQLCVWYPVLLIYWWCSHQLAKRGVAMDVAYCKKVHNFQIDSQTCRRFSGRLIMSQRTAD